MNVTDLMTKAVVVVTPQDTVKTALRLLEDCEIRHLPVMQGQSLVGIVSDRDLREYRLPVLEELEHTEYADLLLSHPVADAMNTDPVFVDDQESVSKAIDVMIEFGVSAVPVVERNTRHLLGMLSVVDVLKAVRGSL